MLGYTLLSQYLTFRGSCTAFPFNYTFSNFIFKHETLLVLLVYEFIFLQPSDFLKNINIALVLFCCMVGNICGEIAIYTISNISDYFVYVLYLSCSY